MKSKEASTEDRLNGEQQDVSDSESEADESDSDTDTEEKEDNAVDMDGLDLAHLTTEISTKQKLIDQLEMSHQRIQVIKQHYEEKLTLLQVNAYFLT